MRDDILDALTRQLAAEGIPFARQMVDMMLTALCSSQHSADLLREFVDEEHDRQRSAALTEVFLTAGGWDQEEIDEIIASGYRWVMAEAEQ